MSDVYERVVGAVRLHLLAVDLVPLAYDRLNVDIVSSAADFLNIVSRLVPQIPQRRDGARRGEHWLEEIPGAVPFRKLGPHLFNLAGKSLIRRVRAELLPA